MATRSSRILGSRPGALRGDGRPARVYPLRDYRRRGRSGAVRRVLGRLPRGAALSMALFATAISTHLILFHRAKRRLGF